MTKNVFLFSSWSDLKDLFRKCGTVTYTDAHYRMGQNRGEVCFEREEELKRALKDFDGYELNGREITVKRGVRKYKTQIDLPS